MPDVPADVAAVDRDSNGLLDRIYFADTKGNVWRTDIDDANPDNWTTHHIASLGGTGVNARKFLNKPDVVLGRTYDAVLVGALTLFFLSLRGLHRQMRTTRERAVERARRLYSEAYEPLRDRPSLEMLEKRAGLLSAAEALEKRAEHIRKWPFDEGTFARVVTIASGAFATIIARLLLKPFGI